MVAIRSVLTLCTLLATSAYATTVDFDATEKHSLNSRMNEVVPDQFFWKRDTGYEAPETTKQGANCVDAFGAGFLTCREATPDQIRLCYNPSQGQMCCQNLWGCPAQSFCLAKNYCCPTSQSASTCANTYGIPLPSTPIVGDSGPAKPGSVTTLYISTTVHVKPTPIRSTVSGLSMPCATATGQYRPGNGTGYIGATSGTGEIGTHHLPTGTGNYIGPAGAEYRGGAEHVAGRRVEGGSLLGLAGAVVLAMFGMF